MGTSWGWWGHGGDNTKATQEENVKRALVGPPTASSGTSWGHRGGGGVENVKVGTHGDVLGTSGVEGTWPR